ncbi:flagellin lysine-N-methylase [Caloranaerobacter sp. DY30410]|uniref:flagellin lysine-N-methylase n=1 Tax=Caloranaerobacter sp. DY30410 TaxID=3238305 RepID=UPI003D00EC86
MKEIIVPEYIKDFKCIASACEDTCCIGWQVNIDKKTYKKYNKCKNKKIKNLLNKYITRNRSNPNDFYYAKIRLNEGEICPFLDKEKLCTIQKELGEDYLSDTCSTYPRFYNLVDDVLEKSATLSCPEIARRALLNSEGIDFEQIEEVVERGNIIQVLNTKEVDAFGSIKKYFWDLRIFSIQLLKSRDYSIAERLIILGMFFDKVQKYIEENNINEIPQLIEYYVDKITRGIFKNTIKSITPQPAVQMKILKELADERICLGINNQRYLECFNEFLEGIQYTENLKEEEIVERYNEAYVRYYKIFMDKHEYILENYIVDYIYKNLFPVAGKESVFDNYVMLVINYALIKMHLIGMAGYHKENFNVEHIIKLIQSFTKVVAHNNSFIEHIYNLLKQNNFISMAYMAIFIKNS